MTERADIAIVGAGAAGLAAAIFAAEASLDGPAPPCILLLDGAASLGAKILVSGGGRCNVTNEAVRAEDFHGTRTVVHHVLAAFDERATVRWFASLGVALKREETGKLFPVTDRARTVLDALLRRCRELGVPILTRRRVTAVAREGDGFLLRHEQGALAATRLILATGGRSLPRSGSDGAGWELVRALGHRVTTTRPALVPLVLDPSFFHAELSGLAQEAELTTLVEGRIADRRTGSLLWTHFGVSGPVVMDASRAWTTARAEGQAVEVRLNFLPGTNPDDADRLLIEQAAARPRLGLAKLLARRLPDRLAAALCRRCGLDPSLAAGRLTREGRRALVRALTALPLPVLRDRGWNFAEVTAGGVPLEEIDFRTMASRLVPGLHLVGELLDCDGRIGGFNFQWAWATGFLAGRGAARALAAERHGARA